MKVIAEGDLLELITTGKNRRYLSVSRNKALMTGLHKAVGIMMSVNNVRELASFSYLHYEQLKYGYSGKSSVRLSNRYVHRLIFEEKEDGLALILIEINDTHYGNK